MRASIFQTVILASIGLSATSCRISEPTPRPETDNPVERDTQDIIDDHASLDASVVESADVASSDMIDSGMEDAVNCDGGPCDLQCEVDEECQHLARGGITFYCDLGEGRCEEGCYEGSCSGDLMCDLEQRYCRDRPCTSSADCSTGQYCEPQNLICLTACGGQERCPDSEVCDPVSERCVDSEIFDSTTGITWVYVPAGSFWMGSEDDNSEQPVHQVTVQAFRMSETEVTVGQYRRCVQAGRCQEPGTFGWCSWTASPSDMEDLPVNCMRWDQARTFAKWAGGDLPTEAQWEYAARGGENTEYAGSNDINEVSWWFDNTGFSLQPVKTKMANGYRLYDMSGNLMEWTLDLWHDNYMGAPAQAEIPWGPIPECDQVCDVLMREVVTRSGSFASTEHGHRVTGRQRYTASNASDNHGIRLYMPLF